MISRYQTGLRRFGLAALLALGLAACDNAETGEGTAERAGQAIDNAASEAADSVGRAMERAGDTIQDATQQAQEPQNQEPPERPATQ